MQTTGNGTPAGDLTNSSSVHYRRDNQIMTWELLVIDLGVSTFAERLKGRRVRVCCDNAEGESTLRAGAARV